MIRRVLLTIFALVVCLGVTSCGSNINVETGVKHSIYDLDNGDMISFYMTSDKSSQGVWSYSIDGEAFEIFDETEENQSHGKFNNQTANFKTLILKPKSEGSAKITFTLEKTGETKEFILTVSKDENKVFRIKAE